MIVKKQHFKSIAQLCCRSWLLVGALLMLSSVAQADGGFVELHQEAGPFVVTVFTSPGPLRAGVVDISVLVQDRANGGPVLDVDVFVRLRSEAGITLAEPATRELAQNKLLYSAIMNLTAAGQWEMEVIIKQAGHEESVLGQVSAAAPLPYLFSDWRSILLPPVVILLFALNQLLKRRAAQRQNAAL